MAAVEVSYRLTGQGPALSLVHGIGARKTTWDPLIDGLKDQFTCVSYDLRGHGESPLAPTPYTLDDLVDDLEALRQKLGHDKIHVAGHSLGGMIGPAYARAYPEHSLSVGLLSTAAGRSEDDRAKRHERRQTQEMTQHGAFGECRTTRSTTGSGQPRAARGGPGSVTSSTSIHLFSVRRESQISKSGSH